MAFPLLPRSNVSESDVTLTNRRRLQDTPATPVSQATPTTSDFNLRNGK